MILSTAKDFFFVAHRKIVRIRLMFCLILRRTTALVTVLQDASDQDSKCLASSINTAFSHKQYRVVTLKVHKST